MKFHAKSRFGRLLSFAMVFVLLAGSMAAYRTKENTAKAAVNSTKEFRTKFVAECLARVGWYYKTSGGYNNAQSKEYDCTGLIGAVFNAMGFRYGFGERTSSNTWGYWGTDKWLSFTSSLKVGQTVTLYNTDNTQYLKFYVKAKDIDLTENPDAAPEGSIIIKPATGSSGAHATISLGTFEDQGSPAKNVAYVRNQLVARYGSAYKEANFTYKKASTLAALLATNGTMYNNSNNVYGCANVWDWRQRNSIPDFNANTSTQAYSPLWQVDALNTKMGVTVNNNVWGKAKSTVASMILEFEKYGSCTFTKTDDSGHALAGATFGVYASSSDAAAGKNVLKTATSGSTGKITFSDLVCTGGTAGTNYYVKEITAPKGYVLSSTVYPVKIYPDTTTSVNGGKISNTPWKGSVSLTKLEAGTGKKLSGFTFTVYEWDGSKYQKLANMKDNGDGTYTYASLAYSQTNQGKFRLMETATDGKHVLKEDWHQDFTLTRNGQTFSYELENEVSEVDAYLCLYKQSDTGEALKGVQFAVFSDESCTELLQTLTTNGDGYAKSSAISVLVGEGRTIYVREVYKDGLYGGSYYVKNDTVYAVTLTEENTEANPARVGGEGFVIVNERRLAYLSLTKLRDDTNEPLSGVSFRISRTADMKSVFETITTNESGYAKSSAINIPADGYVVYVQEVPREGFAGNETIYAVTLQSGQTAVVNSAPIYNTPTKVEISKTDLVSGKELAGATLQILDKDGKPVSVTTADGQSGTSWITTGEVTKIYAQLLAGETYTLKETAAPDGYVLASEVKFTVNADGSVTKVTMEDDCTKVLIRKVAK